MGLELERARKRHWHGALGGGFAHAEVHGLAWRRQGGGFRSHDRLDVQGIPAEGPEEKREVEAELRAYLDSWDAPRHEAFRVFRVPQGHAAMRLGADSTRRSLGMAFEVTKGTLPMSQSYPMLLQRVCLRMDL